MGITASKSPLERRNTVARRSQRRTIHSLKAKVEKVFPNIKRFKGLDKDEDYHALYSELEHLENELKRKSRDLQPQIRNIYDNTLKKIDEAFAALDDRLKENQEKAAKKEREKEEKQEKKKEKSKSKEADVTSEVNDIEIEEIEEPPLEAKNESNNLEQSTEKRKTVELKFIKVIPGEAIKADVHSNNNNVVKSPEEKRKSILKHGVAVMPGAMMNEMAARSSHSVSIQEQPKPHVEQNNENISDSINEIIENLQAIEYQVADFIGKKNGTQYNRIKDKLNDHMATLDSFSPSDDYTAEQIHVCRNYVTSCLNFLDEKVIEDEKQMQDDVFLPMNFSPPPPTSPIPTMSPPMSATPTMSPPMSATPTMSPVMSPALSPIDARNKLERLSKTTAI